VKSFQKEGIVPRREFECEILRKREQYLGTNAFGVFIDNKVGGNEYKK
jgi:hypothetical protein